MFPVSRRRLRPIQPDYRLPKTSTFTGMKQQTQPSALLCVTPLRRPSTHPNFFRWHPQSEYNPQPSKCEHNRMKMQHVEQQVREIPRQPVKFDCQRQSYRDKTIQMSSSVRHLLEKTIALQGTVSVIICLESNPPFSLQSIDPKKKETICCPHFIHRKTFMLQ